LFAHYLGKGSVEVEGVFLVGHFIFFRKWTWILVTKLISEIKTENDPLTIHFFDKTHLGFTISTILAWEVVWNLMIALSLLEALIFDSNLCKQLIIEPIWVPPTVLSYSINN